VNKQAKITIQTNRFFRKIPEKESILL